MPQQASQSSKKPPLPPGYYDAEAAAKPALPPGYYDIDEAAPLIDPRTARINFPRIGEIVKERRVGRIAEDIVYPGAGAFAGGAAGLALGGPPGAVIGAAGGGGIGQAALNIKRRLFDKEQLTPTQQAVSILASAAAGPLQELKPILGATRAGQAARATQSLKITPQLQAAEEFGVEITKGQAGNRMRRLAESLLSKSLGGGEPFRELGLKQAQQLEGAVEQFASSVSKSKLSKEQAGNALQEMLSAARTKAGTAIQTKGEDIVRALPGLKVPQAGALSDEAAKLAAELKAPTAQHPALRKLAGEDIQQAITVLEEFAKKRVKLSVQNAMKLRSLLFKLSDSEGVASIGQASLKHMNKSLHTAIGEAVNNAGRKDLFNAWQQASTKFHEVADNLETPAIKRLLKEDKPELIVEFLLQKGGESRIARVIDLVGEEQFKPVGRATVEKIFEQATSEGILISQSFANVRKKIGNEAIQKLLGGGEQVAQFERLSKLIDSLGLTGRLTSPERAIGGMGLLQGGLAGAGAGIAAANPERALGGLAFSAGVLGIPAGLARIVTRPGGMATVEKAITAGLKEGSKEAAVLRLAVLIAADQSKQQMLRKLEPKPEIRGANVEDIVRSLMNRPSGSVREFLQARP